MTQDTSRRDVSNIDEMWSLISENDQAAVNALFKLIAEHETIEKEQFGGWVIDGDDLEFLESLAKQAAWRRREHEQGLCLDRPVLTHRQMVCLRRALDNYQSDLWIIACRQTGVEPYGHIDDNYDLNELNELTSRPICDKGAYGRTPEQDKD